MRKPERIYFLYRPVMDYEDSEKVRLAFSTLIKAEEAQEALRRWLRDTVQKAKQIPGDGDFPDYVAINEMIKASPAPYGWEFDYCDLPPYSNFDPACVSLKSLPIDPP